MIRKALDISLSMSRARSHMDLELLVSRWSVKTHMFVTSCREFTPTWEDVSVMFRLPLFADEGATGLILSEEEKRRWQLLNVALGVSNKSTFTSWIRYSQEGEGRRIG